MIERILSDDFHLGSLKEELRELGPNQIKKQHRADFPRDLEIARYVDSLAGLLNCYSINRNSPAEIVDSDGKFKPFAPEVINSKWNGKAK